MKHYLLLFLAIVTFTSCNDDDDYNEHDYHLEYTSVIDVDVPDEFIYGRTYEIDVTIELQDGCHYFYNQYEYRYEGTARLIYPIVHIDDNVPCTENIRETTFSIRVQALQAEPYIFMFYQGEDADGQDQFLKVIVPVI
ncbi:MAG: hypothetical protein KAH07_05560 [Flavobacteriaceae bacterium]|nr:hypothetical protein [Flavobacteriaceae bacterium]